VPLALEKSETYLWLFSGIRDVSLEPEHVFFERPSLVSFDSWETPVARMPDVFENVAAWGSRYPNHDNGDGGGGADDARPGTPCPTATVAKYLGGNAIRHSGSGEGDVGALRALRPGFPQIPRSTYWRSPPWR